MNYNNQQGQLLLEILIAISAAAIIVVIGGQVIYTGMQSNKISGEKDVAMGLVNETFETVRSAATEKWQNVFDLTKGTTNYYPNISAGKWVLTSGQENVTINNITYVRSFTVQNVCRDTSTERNITGITDTSGSTTTCAASGGTYDPSTQRITTAVSWPNADAISSSEYITRWMNKVCVQTSWDTAGSGTYSCPTTNYESKTNITSGASLQLCNGGC